MRALVVVLSAQLAAANLKNLAKYVREDAAAGAHVREDAAAGDACSAEQLTVGSWRQTPLQPGWECTQNEHRNCAKKNAQEHRRIAKSLEYRWKPDGCRMRDFDPAVMGGFLRDRKLIYVGDSLNGDMAVSMICMMGGRREAKHIRAIRSNNLISEECKFAKTVAAIERACNKTAIREDWREKLAKQRVNEHDVMILNTGAHWYGGIQKAKVVMGWVSEAINELFHGRLLYRTITFGHEQCHKYSHPGETGPVTMYNWATFPELNAALHEVFSTHPKYTLLNVSMFDMRGDGHIGGGENTGRDCLHYCVPGPINEWNRLLYHNIWDEIHRAA